MYRYTHTQVYIHIYIYMYKHIIQMDILFLYLIFLHLECAIPALSNLMIYMYIYTGIYRFINMQKQFLATFSI